MMRTETMTKTKAALVTSAAMLLAAGLAGCQGATATGASDDANGDTSGPYHIVYTAGSALVTDWDVFVMEDLGLYEKYNLDIESVTTETANAATQLLVTGEANIGRGLPPMIQAIAASNGGVALLDVADTLIRPPFHLNAVDGVDAVDDLVGKNIGTSSPTDSTTVVTIDVLTRLGIDPDSVEIITAGGTAARLAGLESGALDASLLFPPISYTAVDEGFHSLGFVPDLIDDYYFSFGAVVVNPTWAAQNHDALVAYLKARNEALQYMNDPANKDAVIATLAQHTETDVEVAAKAYEDLHIGTSDSCFNSEIGIHEKAATSTLEALQAMGQAPSDMTLADIVDDGFAAEARG